MKAARLQERSDAKVCRRLAAAEGPPDSVQLEFANKLAYCDFAEIWVGLCTHVKHDEAVHVSTF